jgi:hypothetical protein
MSDFKFRLGQRVMLQSSRQSGRVEGRAEFIGGRRDYRIRMDVLIAGKELHWHPEEKIVEEE